MSRAVGYLQGTAIVIVCWWLAAFLLDTPALPGPYAALCALASDAAQIGPALAVSTLRILLSLAIGTVLGAPFGLWLGRSAGADRVLGPVLGVLYPIPKVVFLPVLFVMLGLGGEAKVALISVAVFFQVAVSMRDAARAVPASAVLSVRSLGGTRADVMREVVFPATTSALFTALRVTCGTAIAVLFIAEGMAGSSGLGYYVMHSWTLLDYDAMFAGIVAFAVLGIVVYELFEAAERFTSRWR